VGRGTFIPRVRSVEVNNGICGSLDEKVHAPRQAGAGYAVIVAGDLVIRAARPTDARAIAEVSVASRQWSYRDVFAEADLACSRTARGSPAILSRERCSRRGRPSGPSTPEEVTAEEERRAEKHLGR
jgi:hypothetical protein